MQQNVIENWTHGPDGQVLVKRTMALHPTDAAAEWQSISAEQARAEYNQGGRLGYQPRTEEQMNAAGFFGHTHAPATPEELRARGIPTPRKS